jgi:hypothetical protein
MEPAEMKLNDSHNPNGKRKRKIPRIPVAGGMKSPVARPGNIATKKQT